MTQPNLNPQVGQVLTYNGPTQDKSWETKPTTADLNAAMVLWIQSLPTSAGGHGTWWNNGGVPTYVA